jgi:hypothetical protein
MNDFLSLWGTLTLFSNLKVYVDIIDSLKAYYQLDDNLKSIYIFYYYYYYFIFWSWGWGWADAPWLKAVIFIRKKEKKNWECKKCMYTQYTGKHDIGRPTCLV